MPAKYRVLSLMGFMLIGLTCLVDNKRPSTTSAVVSERASLTTSKPESGEEDSRVSTGWSGYDPLEAARPQAKLDSAQRERLMKAYEKLKSRRNQK